MRRAMTIRIASAACFVAATAWLAAPRALAQPPGDETGEAAIDELTERIEKLEREHRREVERLEQRIAQMEGEAKEGREGIARRLESEVDYLESLLESEDPEEPRVERFNLLNPSLTVFGNFVGRLDDQDVVSEDGDRISDRFNLRETEIDLRAAVDPYARGVLIATIESEVPGEFDTGVEEGYVLLETIPGLDRSPLGLKFQVGRFRPKFGRLNQVHTHDLPFTTRPGSYRAYLGEEGFFQNGIGAEFFVPTPGESNTLLVNAAWLNGGEIPLAEANDGRGPAWQGRLGWFVDLGSGHDFEVGGSGYLGPSESSGGDDAVLVGLDLTYRHRPFARGQWTSFIAGAEVYGADVETEDFDSDALGGFVWSQYQLDRRIYLGARYDRFEELEDDSLETQSGSLFVTYYTSEFLRLRLGYERIFDSDVDERDGLDTLLFELNFVFGSHPPHPYWVSF